MIYYVYFLTFFIFLCLVRMPFVESFFEKLVFLSALSSFVVILMCMLAVIYKKEFYLDIALMYSLLSFTGMLCFAWFFKKEQIKK